MESLSVLRSWEVDNAAAAVVDPTGVIASWGDLGQPFALASVTKPLSAYCALIAVEEGTISLTNPCGPPGATVEHLLSHTSGLGLEDTRRPISRVGVRRIYSNAAFDILGKFVGDRAGMAFDSFVHEGLFEPLEMGDAMLGDSAARSAVASASSMARFVGELLSPTLLDPSTVRRATSVVFPGLAGVVPGFGRYETCDWGLGFELKDSKSPHWTGRTNSPSTFGHFGQRGTFFWIDPAVRIGLIALTDRHFGEWAKDAWPKLSDSVLSEYAA